MQSAVQRGGVVGECCNLMGSEIATACTASHTECGILSCRHRAPCLDKELTKVGLEVVSLHIHTRSHLKKPQNLNICLKLRQTKMW